MNELTPYQKLYQKSLSHTERLDNIEGCILYSGVFGGDEERSIQAAAEIEQLKAEREALLTEVKKALGELQSTQDNWRDEHLFNCNDILSAVIHKAEKGTQ